MTDASGTLLAEAYDALVAADVEAVAGFPLPVLADIAIGSPQDDPYRYSPAEIRLARALLLVASRAVLAGVGWQEMARAAE
jgi:hypothetical protein